MKSQKFEEKHKTSKFVENYSRIKHFERYDTEKKESEKNFIRNLKMNTYVEFCNFFKIFRTFGITCIVILFYQHNFLKFYYGPKLCLSSRFSNRIKKNKQ